MTTFNPLPGDKVVLDPDTYQVMPHPVQPAMAFGQEGRKAIVFQLSKNGSLFALKVFKPKFRQPKLVDTCQHLSTLTLPGLEVCRRHCLTRSTAPVLLQQFPEMEYAVLMPWIQGSTWFDIVITKTAIDKNASQKIAKNTATVLAQLEHLGYAHCDVAAPNVIVNTQTGLVNFIDVEDMFGPSLPRLGDLPGGTDGYHHHSSRTNADGQWCREGDRFSSAVLLAEMLAWHDPRIRQEAEEDHYFAEKELQDASAARYQLMLDVLGEMSHDISDCFARAWLAPSLADCPSLAEWAKLVEFPFVLGWTPIHPPAPQQSYNPESWTPIAATSTGYNPVFVPLDPSSLITPSGAVSPSATGSPHKSPRTPPYFRLIGARTLAWVPVDGAQSYLVELSHDLNFANPVQIYSGADTRCVDPDQSSGVRYYRIRAVNAGGASNWSDSVQSRD